MCLVRDSQNQTEASSSITRTSVRALTTTATETPEKEFRSGLRREYSHAEKMYCSVNHSHSHFLSPERMTFSTGPPLSLNDLPRLAFMKCSCLTTKCFDKDSSYYYDRNKGFVVEQSWQVDGQAFHRKL